MDVKAHFCVLKDGRRLLLVFQIFACTWLHVAWGRIVKNKETKPIHILPTTRKSVE